jgi:hypothetical protein
MFIRFLSTAALAGGLVVAPPQADSAPSVTTLRYKVSTAIQSTVDLSMMGAGEQKSDAGFTGFLTMTLKDTTGGRALTAVLDSMMIDAAPMGDAMLQAAADSAKGSTWHGLLTKSGKIENLTLVRGSFGAQQFENVLMGFFPRGSAHTRKKGDVWADTLAFTSTSDAGTMNLTLNTTFTAAGEGTYEGAKALMITTTTATSSAGDQEGPGGAVQIEGTGTGTGTHYVTKDGTYLGGSDTLNSEILLTTSQAPMPIPITARTVVTISSL